jgi:hypothetical protein
MPYIKTIDRGRLLMGESPEHPGELAYILYCLMVDWCDRRGAATGLGYEIMSSAIGVIETVKHEFERRMLDPYEETKRKENFDVSREEARRVAETLYKRIKLSSPD